MARKQSQEFTINSSYEIRDCPEHGKSNHRHSDGLCARCHPKTGKGYGTDLQATEWRHAIESHQERRAEADWFGEA